ncbi:NAD-dependent epimerase/dehydratase family protein [Sphingobacterium corticibacterium]|uniref:NAD(P)-dependent oxidoreductase n=1 Tax=Sphingobacterium corticibacterium TaxID=2484746 RepID=A0A4Q6XE25_9SPHI|nr:NAD(P)-dependent oxidoreductase [Sphingobacterium corticibacterium]RZF58051.1 NAD(P)-dependent oxidoreductase [Sphingobacterium corticibacterium]
MKKILVTGASGFVGFHLVSAAYEAGYEIHAAVRRSSQITDINPFVGKFVYPDFNQINSWATLFASEKYDYVIHAAAMTKAKSEVEMMDANVGVTERLLQAAFQSPNPPQRLVYVSSLAAIGPVSYLDGPITESTPYRPVTMYGRSKREAEKMIRGKFADKPISIIRPTAVYGPREKDLFILFNTMNKGIDAYVGRAPQKLSFVYVKDLVEILLRACVSSQTILDIFNISDGNVYSRYEMAEIFKQTFRKKLVRVHVPYAIVKSVAHVSQWLYSNSVKTPVIYPERLGELTAENWACDISHAETVLGYRPVYDLNRGLTDSLRWYKQNNWF